MKETVKAKCCEMGRAWIVWMPGRHRWHRTFIEDGPFAVNYCPDCGTKLEAPKPPRVIVLDEEARKTIWVASNVLRAILQDMDMITVGDIGDTARSLEQLLAAANHTGGE